MAFHIFEKIQHSVSLRITVYLGILFSYYAVISLIMVSFKENFISCNEFKICS